MDESKAPKSTELMTALGTSIDDALPKATPMITRLVENGNWNKARKKLLEDPNIGFHTKLFIALSDVFASSMEDCIAHPVQQEGTGEELSEEEEQRLISFIQFFNNNSAYTQIVEALEPEESVFGRTAQDRIPTLKRGEITSAKEMFALCYFAIHPDIRPAQTQITQADKEEAIEQFKRFEPFLINLIGKESAQQPIKIENFIAALETFLRKEYPATEAQELIEHLNSVVPDKHVIPNNKLANTLTRIPTGADVSLEVSKIGAKKLTETKVILSEEGENVQLSGRRPFTEYDRNVYNAVSSLFVYGDPSHRMTPAMVYRAMTGMTGNEKPTREQIKTVTESLDKMRFIRVRIDCTAELQKRRITLNSKQINRGMIDTSLLMAKACEVESGGNIVKAYHVMDPPILYEYAAALKQVLTLPASMLDVKILDKKGNPTRRSLPNTESRILIKGYLLRRIEGLKGGKLHNPVIALYDYEKDGETHQGLCSIAGKPNADRTEARRIREDAEKMLSFWQAVGFIKGYETISKARQITGYKIEV